MAASGKYDALKRRVLEANLMLPKLGLVAFTWGNVSELDVGGDGDGAGDGGGLSGAVVAIKPSGVAYDAMKADDIVVVDLDGNVLEGDLRPSSDLPTHLVLYKAFAARGIRGVTHTHSEWATAWAQACLPIPALGTTHADYFYGEIPCARALRDAEIEHDYEKNTGVAIAETFERIDPAAVPAALARWHGPFAWGTDAHDSVHNAAVLELVAKMAFASKLLQHGAPEPAPQALLDKHYYRKHGAGAYYGQSK